MRKFTFGWAQWKKEIGSQFNLFQKQAILMAKRGLAQVHYTFVSFIVAHWTLSFCTKFCRNVSKVMLSLLHLNKWNFRLSGADARSLKLALIFTIFSYHVLTEAWRTKFSIRWGWEELTKHYQCLKFGSKKSACPPWRKRHVLVSCAQSSVKSQQNLPKLNSFTHLANTWTGIITKCPYKRCKGNKSLCKISEWLSIV